MSVFLCENRKNSFSAGGYASRRPVVPPPPFAKSWVRHRSWIYASMH